MHTVILSREATTTRGHVSRRVWQQVIVPGDSEHAEQLVNEFMQDAPPGKGPYGIWPFGGVCDFILVVLRLLEAAPFILGALPCMFAH